MTSTQWDFFAWRQKMKQVLKSIFFMYLLVLSQLTQANSYHFAYITGLVDQEVGVLIMKRVYEKAGLTLTATPFPGLRAQSMANSGEMDGEVMRIWGYGDQTKNVIRVPTPFYSVVTTGFHKESDPVSVNSKEDLKKYSLLKVLGVKHTDEITKGISSKNITNVSDPIKMMKFLHDGKPNLALTNPLEGDIIIKQLKYTNIVPLKKPLATQPLYHYLHKSHADLVPKIDATLKSLQGSGELDKIVKESEEQVIKARVG